MNRSFACKPIQFNNFNTEIPHVEFDVEFVLNFKIGKPSLPAWEFVLLRQLPSRLCAGAASRECLATEAMHSRDIRKDAVTTISPTTRG